MNSDFTVNIVSPVKFLILTTAHLRDIRGVWLASITAALMAG
jgi:hypothetical protein